MKYIVLASMAATLMISSASAEIPKGNLKIAQSFSVHFKLRRHLYEVRRAICWNGQNREHLRGEREGM
jgi:hypothetical protein